MTFTTFRDPLLSALAPRLGRLEPRARALVSGLTPAQLRATPPGGGWSVSQVLEHLCLGNEAYLGPLEAAIARARRREGVARPHRPSFFGGLLARAVAESSTRRLPTSPKMRPLIAREGVLEFFLATLARIGELAREADGADLCTGMWSPIAPIRLNVGDAFLVLVAHSERHLGQAERARRSAGG